MPSCWHAFTQYPLRLERAQRGHCKASQTTSTVKEIKCICMPTKWGHFTTQGVQLKARSSSDRLDETGSLTCIESHAAHGHMCLCVRYKCCTFLVLLHAAATSLAGLRWLISPLQLRSTQQASPCACSETYRYYTLPFCAPDEKKYKSEGLGDVLAGDRAVNTLFDIRFGKDTMNQTLCTQHLNAKQVQEFRRAVASEYYFQVRPLACAISTWACAPSWRPALTCGCKVLWPTHVTAMQNQSEGPQQQTSNLRTAPRVCASIFHCARHVPMRACVRKLTVRRGADVLRQPAHLGLRRQG